MEPSEREASRHDRIVGYKENQRKTIAKLKGELSPLVALKSRRGLRNFS